MKNVYLLTLVLFALPSAQAANSDARPSKEIPASCAVRMTNSGFTDDARQESNLSGYCSGTLISPTMVVTAAHCMDDMNGDNVGNLDKFKHSKYFSLSFNGSTDVQNTAFLPGDNTVYATPAMLKGSNRDTYKKEGTQSLRGQDFAIVTMKYPVKGYDPKVCPHLPSPSDCQEISAELKGAKPDHPVNIQATYFLSAKVTQREGLLDKAYFIPQAQIYPSQSQSTTVFNDSTMSAHFSSASKVMHLRTGDSGTGIVMSTKSGPVIIGVQTAAFVQDDSGGLFSMVCPHISDPRWAQVVGRSQTQTASAAGSAPLVPGSGASKTSAQ